MNLFLGFEFAPVEGWENILPAPKAPSNYKDAAKIKAYIAKEIQKLADGKAAADVLSGALSRAVVLGEKDGKITKLLDAVEDGGAQRVSHKLTEFLATTINTGVTTLWGYKINKALRLCGIDLMSDSGRLVKGDHWLLGFSSDFRYGQSPGYVDPVSVIFGTSDTDIFGIVKRLKLKRPRDDAEAMAEFAYALTSKLGLV